MQTEFRVHLFHFRRLAKTKTSVQLSKIAEALTVVHIIVMHQIDTYNFR